MRERIAAVLFSFILSLSGMSADTAESVFSLSVKLDSRSNVRSSITGVLRESEGGHYPLTLTVDQHLTDSKMRSSTMQGYKLELGTWKNGTDVVSSAFNDIEERDVLLERGECPNGANEPSR